MSCSQTVYNAIKSGYRLLDGAGDYGNEKEAGEGLRRAIADGIVKREDVCEYMHISRSHTRGLPQLLNPGVTSKVCGHATCVLTRCV